jgi:hypothetical protein
MVSLAFRFSVTENKEAIIQVAIFMDLKEISQRRDCQTALGLCYKELMLFYKLMLFSAVLALGLVTGSPQYSHLPRNQSDQLASLALRICSDTTALATKTSNSRLKDAQYRNCIERDPPSLTGLVVAFYHLKLETKDKETLDFYRKNLSILGPVVSTTPDFKAPKPSWTVANSVSELSGMATDSVRKVIWSLGDSGTGSWIGRTQPDKRITDKISVGEVKNRDWEAIVLDSNGKVWILDVGDNLSVHKKVFAYMLDPSKIDEPSRSAKNDGPDALFGDPGKARLLKAKVEKKIEILYPSGPFDVEAAFFDKGRIYLIGKHYYKSVPVVSFSIAADAPVVQAAQAFGEIPVIPPVTDAYLSPERKLVLLTYFGLYEVLNWDNPLKRELKSYGYFNWGQTEALTSDGAGGFWVGREDGAVFRFPDPIGGKN